jgi:hypothetical protein
MNFVLFLMMNALVLIRPEELFPQIEGLRLYLIITFLCTVTTLPELGELLSWESLRNRPITVCVLLFFASTILSLCFLGRVSEAFFDFGPEFAKIILYYLLLVALVNNEERFRIFIASLVILITALTAIAVAQNLDLVHFRSLRPMMQREWDTATGQDYFISRMVSSGIFNDPNDLCLVLGLGILSCVYCGTTILQGFLGRLLLLLPVSIFIYALMETHSRGGLLGILCGGASYIFSRYGGPRAIPYIAVGVVGALAMIGGRQASLAGGGTAHDRLMIWTEGLRNLFSQPLYLFTGLGNGWFTRDTGLVAHNSFMQAYVELGIFGGGTFLAAFYLGARLLYGLERNFQAPDWAIQARHFGFATTVGYAIGCYSLTRNFVIPTYLALGIASILLDTAAPTFPERFQVSRRWFCWLILFSICGLIFVKFATQGLGLLGV